MSRVIRTFFDFTFNHSDRVIDLDKIESHHLVHVLRLGEGAEVEALNGQGFIIQSKIIQANGNSVKLEVLDKKFIPQPVPFFHLCIALTKGSKWEDLVRPLTELGAGRLTPILTDHSQVKVDDRKLKSRIHKLQKKGVDACKQSGNPWLPKIDNPIEFASLVNNLSGSEAVLMGSLSKYARSLAKSDLKNNPTVTLLIGPEGGWSLSEEKIAMDNNFIFFTLGSNTLRVETAAISGLAIARELLIR